MDLRFTSLEVLAVIVGVFIARMVAEDGESNWLEGLMLLMVYAILALAFFFVPERNELEAGARSSAERARRRCRGSRSWSVSRAFTGESGRRLGLLPAWIECSGGVTRVVMCDRCHLRDPLELVASCSAR